MHPVGSQKSRFALALDHGEEIVDRHAETYGDRARNFVVGVDIGLEAVETLILVVQLFINWSHLSPDDHPLEIALELC